MDKILAINTIKNVFSALGAKTSDSNYAVALLDKTSAEPKGMMDFANLASVLGVGYDINNWPVLNVSTSEGLDAVRSIGMVSAGAITGHSTYSMVFCMKYATTAWPIYLQVEYCHNRKMYIRFNWNGNTAWTDWTQII